ncbi:MAG: ATP-binding protein [Bacteroidota bacterium]|nr:ATP-binding protein [Bacteroidota bacterium]
MSPSNIREAIAAPDFTEADIVVLKKYFEFNKKYYEVVNKELTEQLSVHPLLGPILKSRTPEQVLAQSKRSQEMQRAAIFDGKWEEYADDLVMQGKAYARMNVAYADWYNIIRIYKVCLLPHIKTDFADSVEDAVDFIDGLSKFIHYAMYGIAESYFQEKNAIIKENEERFRAIFENSADHIYLLDKNGTIEMINHTVKEIRKEDIVGKNIFDLQAGPNLAILQNAVRTVFEEKIPARYETQLTIASAKKFYSSTASPIFNKDGSVQSAVIITRDVTEKKEAEEAIHNINATLELKVQERTEELKSINKELESFSYSVSHDLRGPLRAISGFTQILAEEIPENVNEDAKDAMQEIIANTARMGRLIDDLLAFSRLGKQHVSKVTVDMNELVNAVIADFKKSGVGEKVTFHVSPLGKAQGDYGMLKQVMINLVSNAIKYSSKKAASEIEIGFSGDNSQAVYYVKDNGAGFNMAYYDKLFGVFQRLHGADEFEGNGVGLAIVQRIITKHSGKVWAESKENEGATFNFSLPNN